MSQSKHQRKVQSAGGSDEAKKGNCFVIMPIGSSETDHIWNKVYRPVIKKLDLNPIRIDKNKNGEPLTTQIISHLQEDPILIADLTLARPNCYYEVGYAMGINKHNHLILCCRKDHNVHAADYTPQKGLKIHFDIQSYPVIWWDAEDLSSFRKDLAREITARRRYIKELPVLSEDDASLRSKSLSKPTIPTKLKPAERLRILNEGLSKALDEVQRWKKKT